MQPANTHTLDHKVGPNAHTTSEPRTYFREAGVRPAARLVIKHRVDGTLRWRHWPSMGTRAPRSLTSGASVPASVAACETSLEICAWASSPTMGLLALYWAATERSGPVPCGLQLDNSQQMCSQG